MARCFRSLVRSGLLTSAAPSTNFIREFCERIKEGKSVSTEALLYDGFVMKHKAQAYPDDFRRRLVKAIEAGETGYALARRFGVTKAYVYKVWNHKLRTGSHKRQPQSHHGPIGSVTESMKSRIVAKLQRNPETTIEDVRNYLRANGVRLGHSRVHQILQSLGWSDERKKTLLAATIGLTSAKTSRKNNRVR